MRKHAYPAAIAKALARIKPWKRVDGNAHSVVAR